MPSLRRGPAVWLVLLLLSLSVAACRPASTLPVLYPAPAFSLTDQHGRPFSSSELAGKVVVGDFIFTTCTDVCPLLSGTMSQVQSGLKQAGLLGNKAVIVSFTVDPDHDTAAVLADYAERFGADPVAWRFLTGDRAQIEQLLVTGYKVGAPARVPGREIVHTNRFVVIDPLGQIRWLPRGDEVDVGQLVEEVKRLAA